MSNRLFSVNNPVVHCARKRVRRDWRATLLAVATLLAMAALSGWLWSCVRSAAHGSLFSVRGSLLAMAPVTQGMVYALLMGLSVGGIVLAVRKARRNEMEAELRWAAKETAILCDGDQIKVIMGLDDLREIVNACRAESRVALLFVEAALTTTNLDDYSDALRSAHERLAQVTKTLGELRRSLKPEPAKAGATNSEWPRVAAREDVS